MNRSKVRRLWPVCLWMTIIFATSSTWISSKQFVDAAVTRGPIRMSAAHFQNFWSSYWWVFVKGYHVCEFALLTILLLRALHGRIGLAGLGAFMYACSDEFHQTFVPGRGGKWTDVAIDLIGISLVCGIALAVQHRRSLPSCGSSIATVLPLFRQN